MARVSVESDLSFDSPHLVEGLPGVGLVGKIAADHLVDAFEMTYHAGVHCEGLPRMAVYGPGDRSVRPPVRLYGDAERDLLVLQSDVPVGRAAADALADCLTGWFAEEDVTPLYLSGLPTDQKAAPPATFGVATTPAVGERLDDVGLDGPVERGVVRGPTGALLSQAGRADLDAVGLVVESDAQFPDPEAARALLDAAVGPLAGVDPPLSDLVDRAGEIRAAKEQLAEQMGQAADEEASKAEPLRMYQ
jgi:uncharacterized protein